MVVGDKRGSEHDCDPVDHQHVEGQQTRCDVLDQHDLPSHQLVTEQRLLGDREDAGGEGEASGVSQRHHGPVLQSFEHDLPSHHLVTEQRPLGDREDVGGEGDTSGVSQHHRGPVLQSPDQGDELLRRVGELERAEILDKRPRVRKVPGWFKDDVMYK